MPKDETISIIACPICGYDATYTSITERTCVSTGEYEDDDLPAFETIEAHGFTLECSHCGFADGEPAHW